MRISFRTTLEQELVEMLKQMGAEKNKNMNDILEELLYFYYGDKETVTYLVPKAPENYVGGEKEFMTDEITYISAKIFARNGYEISEDFINVLRSVSTLMTELVIRDKQLQEKIEGNVSVEEIIQNAEAIKNALNEKKNK